MLVALGLACDTPDPAVRAHIDAARQLAAEGSHEEALRELDLALEIDPDNAEARTHAGVALRNLGREDEAIQRFEEAFRLDPLQVGAALEAAGLQLRDRPERTLDLTEQVLELAPENLRARRLRIDALVRRGRIGEALEASRALVSERPEDGVAHLSLAKVTLTQVERGGQLSEEQLTEAAAAFDSAIALLPARSHSRVLFQKARLFGRWPGREADARAIYEQLLQEKAGAPGLRRSIAAAAAAHGRRQSDDALLMLALRSQVADDPEGAPAWIELVRVTRRSGSDGMALLEEAIAAREEGVGTRIARANLLAADGKLDEAVASLTAAADAGIAPDRMLDAAVQLELRRRRTAAARSLAERIEAEWPDSAYATLARARLDLRFGRFRTVVRSLEGLLASGGNESALRLLARALGPLNRHASAADAIERATSVDPDFDLARARLAVRVFHGAAKPSALLSTLAAIERHGYGLSAAEQLMHAQALYLIGNDLEGDRILDELASLGGASVETIVEFGARRRESEPERVETLIALGLANHPASLTLLEEQMKLDLATGRKDEAEALLAKILESGQKLTRSLLLLQVRIHMAFERYDEAEAKLVTLLRVWPNSRRALDLLAEIYERDDRLGELVATFDSAADVGALKLAGPLIAGRLHLRAGDFDRALERLEPLLDAGSGETEVAEEPASEDTPPADAAAEPETAGVDWDRSPALRVDVARALAESRRDLPRAVELGRDGLQLGRDLDAHVALGLALLRSDEPGAAQILLQRAVGLSESLDTPSAAAHLHLGEALRAVGREEEARGSFERALAIDAEESRAREALEGPPSDG